MIQRVDVGPTWRTASYCTGASCVAVAALPDGAVAMRNSSSPGDGTLVLGRRQLRDLLRGICAGEFDDLR